MTDKCNLRCKYCMPAEAVPEKHHAQMLGFEQIVAIAESAVRLGVTKIRLTGDEPLVRRGIVGLVAMRGRVGGLEKSAMTTNGIVLPR